MSDNFEQIRGKVANTVQIFNPIAEQHDRTFKSGFTAHKFINL